MHAKKDIAVFVNYSMDFARRIVQGLTHYIHTESELRWRFPLVSDRLRIIRHLKDVKNFDGLICPIHSRRISAHIRKNKIPCVNLAIPTAGCNIPSVTFDNYRIGQMAAEHLLESGAIDFLYVSENQVKYNVHRWRGFADCVAEAGFTARQFIHKMHVQEIYVKRRRGEPSGLVAPLRKRNIPLGVFASWDYVGYNVIWALDKAGLKCPEEVRVVAVDNDLMYCSMTTPQLSSVDTNPEQVGYEAGRMLEMQFKGQASPQQRLVIPPSELVIRSSSDTVHLHHPQIAKALKLIDMNIRKGMNVAELVDAIGIPRRTLEMQFRKAMDISIHDAILGARLRKAKYLLQWTDLPISKILKQTGFNSLQNFQVAFKTDTGMTPSDFRHIIQDTKCHHATNT